MRLPPEEEQNIEVTALTPERLEATLLYQGKYPIKIIVVRVGNRVEGSFEMDGENLSNFVMFNDGRTLIEIAKSRFWMIEPVIKMKLLFAEKLDDMEIGGN